MTILARLLNKTITIKRVVGVISSSGDSENKVNTIDSSVSGRITRNKQVSPQPVGESGLLVSSTHRLFTNIDVDIEHGDYVQDGTEIYSVAFIDKIPGGKTDSHYEIYINKVDSVTSSDLVEYS